MAVSCASMDACLNLQRIGPVAGGIFAEQEILVTVVAILNQLSFGEYSRRIAVLTKYPCESRQVQ